MSGGSRAWSWRHAFSTSSLPATTKHVLQTVGMFMNELGEGCYPSVADICRYSSLDKKTVMKHLGVAREAGWIAVSQHGFRGQRWKRQEYAACWPDRDLVAACVPADLNEGGGGDTPPSFDKVVELVPEGGGTEGLKVVEEIHQDKTSPITTPITTPIERGVREEISISEKPEDRKSLERSFWRIVKDWPHVGGLPKDEWFAAWCKLTPAERIDAAEKRDAWIALLKANKRDNIPVPKTYFREKLWKDVPDSALKSAAGEAIRKFEPKFGPVWGAKRMLPLFDAPRNDLPEGRNDFLRRLLREDSPLGEAERRKRRIEHGYPEVNKLDGGGVSNTGNPADERFREFAREWMVAVVVNSDVWNEWQSYFDQREWPWVPDTGRQPVVYFPKGGPAELRNFETAVRGLDK